MAFAPTRAVHGRVTHDARPTRLEKRVDTVYVFEEELKFGRVIPARQDKWASSDAKKNRGYTHPSA